MPVIGDWLMSSTRPRWAYRIVHLKGERPLASFRPGAAPAAWQVTFECRRFRPDQVPEGATVHPWKWDPRKKAQHAG